MKISLMALIAGFCLVVGFPLAATAGPTPGGPNSDADSVENAFDNCVSAPNPEQKDFDHDGCGDVCDCDYNNDTVCNLSDFGIMASCFGHPTAPGDPLYNPAVDCNCDGVCNLTDFVCFSNGFLTTPCP